MSKLTSYAPHSGRPFLVYRTQAGKGLDGILEARRGGEKTVEEPGPLIIGAAVVTISDGGTRMFSITSMGGLGSVSRRTSTL